MSKNPIFRNGQENKKSNPASTCGCGSPPKVNHFYRVTHCPCLPILVDVCFCVRQLSCLKNDRMTKTERSHNLRLVGITERLHYSKQSIFNIMWNNEYSTSRTIFYLRQQRRYMFSPAHPHLSVCLSVCVQDYSKTRAWIWMKCCVSTEWYLSDEVTTYLFSWPSNLNAGPILVFLAQQS